MIQSHGSDGFVRRWIPASGHRSLPAILEQPGFASPREIERTTVDGRHPLLPAGILGGVVVAVTAMVFTGCVRTDGIYGELN